MNVHENARMSIRRRLLLVERSGAQGSPAAWAAAGVSERTACKRQASTGQAARTARQIGFAATIAEGTDRFNEVVKTL